MLAGARSTVKTFVFDVKHELLATINQEALIRPALDDSKI